MIIKMSVSPKLILFGVLFAALAVTLPGAFADTAVKSTSFENTSVVEFTNNDAVSINTVRIWLGSDSGDFKSFKTERGWIGTKAADGLLVFTTTSPLMPGESVKFGIKTDVAKPGINWRTVDASGNEVTTGRMVVGEEPAPRQETQQPVQTSPETVQPKADFANAQFRIIPEAPKNGDEIRVVGDGFPADTSLDFSIDGVKLESFASDGAGKILGRAKIPADKQAERVEFRLADSQGNQKSLSIRLIQTDRIMVSPDAQNLTITSGTDVVGPGDTASVTGTARPGTTVSITAKDEAGNKIYEVAVPVNSQGNWSHETVVPPDAPFGIRTVEITNGQDTLTRTISIQSTKNVHLTSPVTRYEPGATMTFNGTAVSGKPVEILIKDPVGREVFSQFLTVEPSGFISFGYNTDQTSPRGTYVVIATQEGDTEILRVGLGEAPSGHVVGRFDKLNYAVTDTASLTLQGPSQATISILILDPSDKVILSDSTTLGLDGRKNYEVKLTGYKAGVYSTVLSYLGSTIRETFAVGLQTSSGPIQMQTTKQTYLLGDGILLLGRTNPNVLITLEMHDPDGELTKRKPIFSDKSGGFSDGTFRVPSDAKQGTWTLKASSGANYAEAKINVVGTVTQAFVISVDKPTAYRTGDIMTITGHGGGREQSLILTVFDSENTRIKELEGRTTNIGSFLVPWEISANMNQGTYKIIAKVGQSTAETTFIIE